MQIPFWTLEGDVDLAALAPENLTASVIGGTLSKINRFNGRTSAPWPVSAHSILVAYLCPADLQPWALLHDAHEAFLGDFTGPSVEFLCSCGTRTAVEHAISNAKGRLDRVIGAAWKVQVRSMNQDLRLADHAALLAEAWRFLGRRPDLASEKTDHALGQAVERAMAFLAISEELIDWRVAGLAWGAAVKGQADLGRMSPPTEFRNPSSTVLAG